MSEPVESLPKSESPAPAADRVGDVLRKERVTRRITLETMAKDLKLNVKYIKSIEANQYHDLPPDPYIRVYLRTIAKYLMLEPDKLLASFFDETGIGRDKNAPATSAKIKMDKVESDKSYKPWIVIIGVVVVLAIISLITNRISSPPAPVAVAVDSTTAAALAVDDSLSLDSIPATLRPVDDSTMPAAAVMVDTVLQSSAPLANARDSIVLVMRSNTDSVWLQIFADGVGTRRFVKKNSSTKVVARDSINIHVGNNPSVEYTLNGKTQKIPGNGVSFVKITRGTIELWGQSKWLAVFKGRL